jgi:long-chain acyl-CoA synthetase
LLRETKEKFEALTGGVVFEGFGLSEAPTATHCNPLLGQNKTGSIGMPMSDVESKIISLDDGTTELAVGEIGELIIRGPQVMKGYHNMPTETANTLRNMDDGGSPWLFTGDIARMDDDGYFYIVDRKKELIKPGGENVYPAEVEKIILQHPAVAKTVVIGVPDPKWKEGIKAVCQLHEGKDLTAIELIRFVGERIASFKKPQYVEFVAALPQKADGSLDREAVKSRFGKV